MKISYNWLKDYVDIKYSAREIAERLTMVGLAVESVQAEGNDYVLEFDLTSNRPDALSHFGIAREVAAICGTIARLSEPKLNESKERTSDVTSVEILDPDLCPRYVARVIIGVKVEPSPDWLVKKLERVGQRSINNIADITNYVLWEQGQPLHAFDFQRLGGKRIVVRTARNGETLRTLDGVDRKLREDMLVIADAEKPSAMAGIMGGEYSEINSDTRDVLLESAYFNPQSIRRTARALELSTEASHRFERGSDPQACARAIDRCAELICELAGGKLLAGAIDVYPSQIERAPIEFRLSRICALTGLEVAPGKAESILQSLGFEVEPIYQGERLRVVAPSYRIDVNIEEDLIEEVARYIGYDNIPLTLPDWGGAGNYLPNEDRRRRARDFLIDLGYSETISFSWVRPEVDAVFRNGESRVVQIQNPIDEERPQMRTSLLPGLLDGLFRNFSFGIRNVRLFETGKCFKAGQDRPDEYERIALIATGQRSELDWQHNGEMIDFYDIKGMVETLLENWGIRDYSFDRSSASFLHGGQSAQVRVGNKVVGHFGQLSPNLQDEYKFKQQLFVAELALDELLSLPASEIKYMPLPKLQAVSRDISILISNGIDYAEIVRAIRSLEIKELTGIRLFDIYTGKNLPPDKRSLSLSFRYQPTGETMTDQQINELDERIINLLASRFEAQLRK
jgi:phenylalanyl-tRNA synthetase beta chain